MTISLDRFTSLVAKFKLQADAAEAKGRHAGKDAETCRQQHQYSDAKMHDLNGVRSVQAGKTLSKAATLLQEAVEQTLFEANQLDQTLLATRLAGLTREHDPDADGDANFERQKETTT